MHMRRPEFRKFPYIFPAGDEELDKKYEFVIESLSYPEISGVPQDLSILTTHKERRISLSVPQNKLMKKSAANRFA